MPNKSKRKTHLQRAQQQAQATNQHCREQQQAQTQLQPPPPQQQLLAHQPSQPQHPQLQGEDDVFINIQASSTAASSTDWRDLLRTFNARTNSQQVRAWQEVQLIAPPTSSIEQTDPIALLRIFDVRTNSQQTAALQARAHLTPLPPPPPPTIRPPHHPPPRAAAPPSSPRGHHAPPTAPAARPSDRPASSPHVPRTPRSQQRHAGRTLAEGSEVTPTRRRIPSPNPQARSTPQPVPDAGYYYAQSHRGSAFKPRADVAREPLRQGVDYRFTLQRASYACRYCGALHWIEERKINSTKKNPLFSCCAEGGVDIPPRVQYPQELQRLLAETEGVNQRTRRTPPSQELHKHIRHYNNSFAFCSLGANIDERLAQRLQGAYTFRAHGHLYHRIGALHAPTGRAASFAQLYIFDSEDEQLQRRGLAFQSLNVNTLRVIQRILLANHPFAQAFRSNAERLRADRSVTLAIGIVEATATDPRRYNRPTASEVAALIPTSADASSGVRHIVLQNRDDGGLQFISEHHAEYLPLRYPLLYPNGELGWRYNYPLAHRPWVPRGSVVVAQAAADGLEQEEPAISDEDEDEAGGMRRGRNGSTRVTQQQWWKHHLQLRHPLAPQLLAGRLFHEVAVDAYASIASSRLQWIKQNQQSLRVAQYAGMLDALHENDRVTGRDIGRNVILPASHTGSPRQMRNAYLDAMALARHFGPPDFFITFTCNPQWQEIQLELTAGQTPTDRPDLVDRVFQLKLKQLQHELLKGNVLGHAVVLCWTIEFQKRGLPHAHMLLILEPAARCRTAEDVDAAIRADLPDRAAEPLLHDVVTRNMLHGPCGERNTSAACMREGRCRFGFPHRFQEETVLGDNRRPYYKRPDNGRTFKKAGQDYEYSNRDVAPYNPYLSVRFNAHINVESCVGYSSVKYAFKYVYKGPDQATISLQAQQQPSAEPRPVDEVQEYIDARYIAAHEALWRIYEFRTHGRSIPVLQLAVHLEDQQIVSIQPEQDVEARLAQDAVRRTTLTEFFAVNARGRTEWRYQDFPAHYTWSKKRKRWAPRQRGFAIGRVVWLPVCKGEVHYLRLLLVNVAGQCSFEDARAFEGRVYPTFQAACLARGLLQDDREYSQALAEAAQFQLGRQLRELFVTVLASCRPADPMALWDRFRGDLADDCHHRLRTTYGVPEPTQEQAEDLALCLLRSILAYRNLDLQSCGLPQPRRSWIEEFVGRRNRLLREQLAFDAEEMQATLAASLPLLNTEQRLIFDTLNHAVESNRGGLFFVDGPGGTGKTFLQNAVLAHQRLQGRVALAVATSGIAATLLAGGTTAHSRFKIPIDVDENATCNVPRRSHLAELLRETRLIFWDEAVMCHRHAIEAVSRTLQDLRDEDDHRQELPFGGVVVCFCGDFRQTLPIVKRGTRGQIVSATLKRSPLWRRVHTFRLTQNMRLQRPNLAEHERQEIAAFAERLLRIGENVDPDGRVQWDQRDQAIGNSVEALATAIFPQLRRRLLSPEVLRDTAILASKNDAVNEVNQLLLDAMPGVETVSYSVDYCRDDVGTTSFPVEFLHTVDIAQLPPHRLRLKVGCPVMLLRNLDPDNGLCNGTRLVVLSASRSLLRCSILGTRKHGSVVQLPRMPLDTPGSEEGVEFTRHQFPVKLAFAMTINKAQGQSLSSVGLLLDPEVFSHGQLYVALSRATRPDSICMVLPNTDLARSGRLKNVVYTEVL